MFNWIVWLLAVYGFTVLFIQFLYRMNWYWFHRKHGQKSPLKVTLLLHNSEGCLEGVVRSMVTHSRLEGRPVKIFACDFGSTDRTQVILACLEKKYPFLFRKVQSDDLPFVVMDIGRSRSSGMINMDAGRSGVVADESVGIVNTDREGEMLTIDLRQMQEMRIQI